VAILCDDEGVEALATFLAQGCCVYTTSFLYNICIVRS
jgi:hypothetical protein